MQLAKTLLLVVPIMLTSCGKPTPHPNDWTMQRYQATEDARNFLLKETIRYRQQTGHWPISLDHISWRSRSEPAFVALSSSEMLIVTDSPNSARVQFGRNLNLGGPDWFVCQSQVSANDDPDQLAPKWETSGW